MPGPGGGSRGAGRPYRACVTWCTLGYMSNIVRRISHDSLGVQTAEPMRAATVRFSTHLNNSDTLLWNIEHDPLLRTTIVAISMLDRSPNWERLLARLADVARDVPRLRQRVVEAPLRLGPPRWQTVDQIDMSYHVRRVVAPAPADLRAVLDIAGPIAMAAFDKDRPLWEFTLVEGLDRGRAALIQKIHHSFTDGVGAIRLAQLMLDDRRNAKRWVPSAAQSVHAGSTATVSRLPLPVRAVQALPATAAHAVSDPVGFARAARRSVRSIGRMLAPANAPLSPTMTGRGLSRRLGAFDVPLDQMRAAAHAAESSLNDAFLASVAGGMRRYHEHHGVAVARLRVTMPVNLRRAGDDLGNNRFTPVRFALPVATLDPSDRMREIGEIARTWRREPALPLTEVIAGVLDRLPVVATTTLFGSMLKGVDFVATNVPGLTQRSFLAGAEVLREYAFAPPTGAALSVALLSHLDQCCIGLNIDTAAVPDPEVLTECVAAGFAEVLAVRAT